MFVWLHPELYYSHRICAHEYEKRREMAAAAFAYKCMEVAYMRVVYCNNSTTNRDRHDLQASLQIIPQGMINAMVFLDLHKALSFVLWCALPNF